MKITSILSLLLDKSIIDSRIGRTRMKKSVITFSSAYETLHSAFSMHLCGTARFQYAYMGLHWNTVGNVKAMPAAAVIAMST